MVCPECEGLAERHCDAAGCDLVACRMLKCRYVGTKDGKHHYHNGLLSSFAARFRIPKSDAPGPLPPGQPIKESD